MNYIIFDLEWNNAYSYARKGFMNEIIEIGAVKLNERLEIVDTFKQLVKPKITKKLSGRCKNLTNITNEELKENGISFNDAITDFAQWSRGEGNVFLSWSNSDLYVLAADYQILLGNLNISFISKYCDAQKYCMSFIEKEDKNQVSLAKCCELFGIDIDTSSLHRALTDCYLEAECFKKVFDKNKIKGYIVDCYKSFFERLIYKPYLITSPKSQLFNVYDQVKKIQPICFENACWAYTVGAAIAIKKDCKRAADAAAAIGEGLQAFCIPGSVADQRKVGLGHGNLGKMLLEEETECFAFLAGHESFAAAEGAIGIAEKALIERGVILVPDFLANAGGVSCSYFEQVQCNMNYYWEREEVLDKLEKLMVTAALAVFDLAKERNVSLRDAAYMIAIDRVVKACRIRGWIR